MNLEPHLVQSIVEEFPALLDALPYRVYFKNRAGEFVYANEATKQALAQVCQSAILGLTDADFFDDAHAIQARSDEAQILNQNNGEHLTFSRFELETWKNGTLTIAHSTKRAWRDSNGAIIGIVGVTRTVDLPGDQSGLDTLVGSRSVSRSQVLGTYLEQLPPVGCSEQGKRPRRIWFDAGFNASFPANLGALKKGRFRPVPKEDRQSVASFLKAARAADSFDETIVFRVEKSDAVTWVHARARVFRFPHSDVRYLIVDHRNCRPEELTTLLSRRVLETFPGNVFVKDSEHRFRYMNQHLLKQIGRCDMQDIIGKTDAQMNFPDAEVNLFREADRIVLADPKGWFFTDEETLTPLGGTCIRLCTIKFRIKRSDLEPWHASNEPYILGFSWQADDNWRKLRLADQIWKALMIHSSDGIYIKDQDSRYLEVNQTFADMLKRPKEEIEGLSTEELWKNAYPEIYAQIVEEDRSILDENRSVEIKRTLVDGSGEKRFCYSRKMPLLDTKDKPCRILGVVRDITLLAHVDYLRAFLAPELAFPPAESLATPQHTTLSVVFCDIRGFSRLASDLRTNPSTLVDLLRRYMDLVVKCAKEHGCIVDKFMGDGAMLICDPRRITRYTTEQEQIGASARDAVRFAMSLQERFPDIVTSWKSDNKYDILVNRDILIGVGIHVGPATIGFVLGGERQQYTALGDTVNTAQRLESLAGKENYGLILVSPAVARYVDKSFDLEWHMHMTSQKLDNPIIGCSVRGVGGTSDPIGRA